MSVRSKRVVRGVGRQNNPTSANHLLDENHPLHASLARFCRGKPLTKRQARKFLQKFPQFAECKQG